MQKEKFILALLLGVIVFCASYYARVLIGGHAGDFSWPLNGARILLRGENPYYHLDLGPTELPQDVLLYPLPALLLVIPLTPFPDAVALSLFLAFSTVLLAYYILLRLPHCTPFVLSAPFWTCILAGQWSIFLTACLLVPLLTPLIVVKPTFTLTALAVQQNKKQLIRIIFAMFCICVFTWPILWTWPIDWLHNLPKAHYERLIIILTIPGILLIFAVTRWRNSVARIFLALALLPQFPNFYDHVALSLIPHTTGRGVLFSVLSWVIFIVGRVLEQQTNATIVLYIVALCFLLLNSANTDPLNVVN